MATQLPSGYAVTEPDTSGVTGNPGPAATGTQDRASVKETDGVDAGEFSSGVGTYTSPPQVVNPPGPPVTGGTLDTEAATGGVGSPPGIVGPINGGEVNTQVYGPPIPGNNAGGPAYRAPLPEAAATTVDTTRTAAEAETGYNGLYGPVLDRVPQESSYALTSFDTLYDSGGAGPGNVAVPAAPAQPTALARVSGARVTWTAPSNSGLPIKGYRVYVYPATGGGYLRTVDVNASNLSALVDNLATGQAIVNGVSTRLAYKFAVAAVNQSGEGPQSALSAAVTPWLDNGADSLAPAALNAPTGVTATGGVGGTTVSWTRPTHDGGYDIAYYTVTATNDGKQVVVRAPGSGTTLYAEPPTSVVFTEESAGESSTYTVTATVKRPNGTYVTSPASAASSSATTDTVPGAPTGVVGTAGVQQVSVAFTAPGSNGGSAITSYTATSSPGGHTASGSASPIVVTGLTTGQAYTFTVHATNAVGNSAESAASSAVTPT